MTITTTARLQAELVDGPGAKGVSAHAEEQKHDRGRAEGEDGWAASKGREQMKDVRQGE